MIKMIALIISGIAFLGIGFNIFVFWMNNPEFSQMQIYQHKWPDFVFMMAAMGLFLRNLSRDH